MAAISFMATAPDGGVGRTTVAEACDESTVIASPFEEQ